MYTDSMNDSTNSKSEKARASHTPVAKSPLSQNRINPVQPNKTVEQSNTSQQNTEKHIATDPYFSVQNLIVGYD
ncbi:hypothetical protein ACTXGQ_30775, partial [Marinobacter sp. 1Y8]